MKDRWITHPPVTSLTRDAMLTGVLPPPPPAISVASIAIGNSGFLSKISDTTSPPLTNTSKHTNITNPQQSKAANKRSSVSNLIDLNLVKSYMATYERNDSHTQMMQQYKEAKEKMELEDYVEKQNNEKVMRDIQLCKEYKQLIDDGTSEEFIQQQFPCMVKFFLKKSTPIVAPKKSTGTPPVDTPVVCEKRVTTMWMPGLLRQLDEPKHINIHCNKAHSCDDSFTDEDEDEECKEFESDGLDANVDDAAADISNKKNLSSPASNTRSKNQVTTKAVSAHKLII
jgi:hypothetical protein